MIDEHAIFNVGVKGIIGNSEKLLLLQSTHQNLDGTAVEFWDLPGGRIMEGSDVKDTLVKEIVEETGAAPESIEIRDLFYAVKSNFFKKFDEKNLYLFLVVYKCRVNLESIKLSEEHSDAKWFSLEEAKSLLATKYPDEFIQKLDQLKEPEI